MALPEIQQTKKIDLSEAFDKIDSLKKTDFRKITERLQTSFDLNEYYKKNGDKGLTFQVIRLIPYNLI
jgi:hypothetical protein